MRRTAELAWSAPGTTGGEESAGGKGRACFVAFGGVEQGVGPVIV